MTRYLTIHVRAHEGRYHGHGDDLASPFRLLQALVAGAAISGPLDEQTKQALTWLEGLPDAPIIASPRTVRGQSVSMFMPNNDLDAKGGDVRRVGSIRLATKVWRPRLFDANVPFIFVWRFDGDDTKAKVICELADKLYQFGRGVDMAWACAEILGDTDLDPLLIEYEGVVSRPGKTNGRVRCPDSGSLESLDRRYRARRFRYEGGRRVFVKPPEPHYRQLAYESPPARHVFELRSTTDTERRVAWPLARASLLVVAAREAARAKLIATMSSRTSEIDRYLVGRKPDGSNAAPAESRVRIIPIPSIGMHYADRAIRRLLVEVPAACPLRSEDVRWAFSGELFDPGTGEVKDVLLSPSDTTTCFATMASTPVPASSARLPLLHYPRTPSAAGSSRREGPRRPSAASSVWPRSPARGGRSFKRSATQAFARGWSPSVCNESHSMQAELAPSLLPRGLASRRSVSGMSRSRSASRSRARC
jgi:CRISPR-associated protein Csb2